MVQVELLCTAHNGTDTEYLNYDLYEKKFYTPSFGRHYNFIRL